ncbi:hypothetical protein MMC25_004599 [Agyrium rufum]|nr:hypothetical protein [Agyrium rufum]
MVADLVRPEVRAEAFSYMTAVPLVAGMVFPMVGSILLQRGGEIVPLLVGLVTDGIGVFFLLMIPEKRNAVSLRDVATGQGSSATSDNCNSFSRILGKTTQNSFTWLYNGFIAFVNAYSSIVVMLGFIQNNGNIALVFAMFLATKFTREVLNFLLQYVSHRLEESFADVSYFLSINSATQACLLFAILPMVNRLLRLNEKNTPSGVSLWIMRGSSIFLTAGAVFIGLASTSTMLSIAIVIFSLDFGFRLAGQSYMTSLVRSNEITQLYTALSLVNTFASFISGPLFGLYFAWGIRAGGWKVGLPLFLCSILFGLSGLGACACSPSVEEVEEAAPDEDVVTG